MFAHLCRLARLSPILSRREKVGKLASSVTSRVKFFLEKKLLEIFCRGHFDYILYYITFQRSRRLCQRGCSQVEAPGRPGVWEEWLGFRVLIVFTQPTFCPFSSFAHFHSAWVLTVITRPSLLLQLDRCDNVKRPQEGKTTQTSQIGSLWRVSGFLDFTLLCYISWLWSTSAQNWLESSIVRIINIFSQITFEYGSRNLFKLTHAL